MSNGDPKDPANWPKLQPPARTTHALCPDEDGRCQYGRDEDCPALGRPSPSVNELNKDGKMHWNEGCIASASEFVDIVFDGPPGPKAPCFVEVESPPGTSIRFGEWVPLEDGYWALRFRSPQSPAASPERLGRAFDQALAECTGSILSEYAANEIRRRANAIAGAIQPQAEAHEFQPLGVEMGSPCVVCGKPGIEHRQP